CIFCSFALLLGGRYWLPVGDALVLNSLNAAIRDVFVIPAAALFIENPAINHRLGDDCWIKPYLYPRIRHPLAYRNPRHRLHLPLWLGSVIPLCPHFFPEDGASIASIRGPFSASR